MPSLDISDLDKFVADVADKGGDLSHPDISERYYPIDLKFKSRVDCNLSPFSDEYYEQQLALYSEISGRELDQSTGELHPVDISQLIISPNPQGDTRTTKVSENVRSISTMLSMSALPDRARVLDLGSGHGLSTEVLAFCGCEVTAVDIDPLLQKLSQQRCAARNLKVEHCLMNFQDVSKLSGNFDAAFFFQCLHHALRPWELIASLKSQIKIDGVIAFTGEPIQTQWWKHWGLRLDQESLYAIRRFGWFESGWSHNFIAECFRRNDLHFIFIIGGHEGGEIGFASAELGRLEKIKERASLMGFKELNEAQNLLPSSGYFSQVGKSYTIFGIPGFKAFGDHPVGALMFGPYVPLKAGRYKVQLLLQATSKSVDVETAPLMRTAVLEIISNKGAVRHLRKEVSCDDSGVFSLVALEFALIDQVDDIEVSVFVTDNTWSCSLPRCVLA